MLLGDGGSHIPLLEARHPCLGKQIKLPTGPKITQCLKPQAGAIAAIPLATRPAKEQRRRYGKFPAIAIAVVMTERQLRPDIYAGGARAPKSKDGIWIAQPAKPLTCAVERGPRFEPHADKPGPVDQRPTIARCQVERHFALPRSAAPRTDHILATFVGQGQTGALKPVEMRQRKLTVATLFGGIGKGQREPGGAGMRCQRNPAKLAGLGGAALMKQAPHGLQKSVFRQGGTLLSGHRRLFVRRRRTQWLCRSMAGHQTGIADQDKTERAAAPILPDDSHLAATHLSTLPFGLTTRKDDALDL